MKTESGHRFGLDFFVSPLPALAVAGMAINDHWLKPIFHNWLTGKISDFLGVFYFPLFLCALSCLSANFALKLARSQRPRVQISKTMMLTAMAVTAAIMILIKVNPVVTAWIERMISETFFRVRLTADPSDLISLVSLVASYLYAKPYFLPKLPARSRQ